MPLPPRGRRSPVRPGARPDPVRAARGWINAIVRNRARNIIRDGSREEPTDAGDLDTLREGDSIEMAFADFDDRNRLKRCLGELDARKRASVMMAYLYGYTHGEIAGRLGVPLGTAKAWVRRGLGALRECMS
jgi:RNA polymerase sigma-70 factor (ECF subfamily)